jgi:hypothetical protein
MHHAIAYLLPLSACLIAFAVWFVFRLPIRLLRDPVRAIKALTPGMWDYRGLRDAWLMSRDAGILLMICAGSREDDPEGFRRAVKGLLRIRLCAIVCPIEPLIWFGQPFFATIVEDAYQDLESLAGAQIEFRTGDFARQLMDEWLAYRGIVCLTDGSWVPKDQPGVVQLNDGGWVRMEHLA